MKKLLILKISFKNKISSHLLFFLKTVHLLMFSLSFLFLFLIFSPLFFLKTSIDIFLVSLIFLLLLILANILSRINEKIERENILDDTYSNSRFLDGYFVFFKKFFNLITSFSCIFDSRLLYLLFLVFFVFLIPALVFKNGLFFGLFFWSFLLGIFFSLCLSFFTRCYFGVLRYFAIFFALSPLFSFLSYLVYFFFFIT